MAFMRLFFKAGWGGAGVVLRLRWHHLAEREGWVCVAMISGGFDFTRTWSCGGGKVQVVREDGIAQF
jgi:hypothetical protein